MQRLHPVRRLALRHECRDAAAGLSRRSRRNCRRSWRIFQREGKLLEAQRLRSRTEHDLEMLEQTGICAGIENYSAHLDGRKPRRAPFTLLDYFPKDFLVVIDESHVAVPQVRGQYAGDRSRKETLVEHGFRLPSALDNRPLNFDEFMELVPQIVFVSATPGPYETEISRPDRRAGHPTHGTARPGGDGRADEEPDRRPARASRRGDRARRARADHHPDQTDGRGPHRPSSTKAGYRVQYLHSDIDTIQRIEILRSLRLGEFDVLVGINLLREGLDLPEVSLVAILDADKEGFLRSRSALIQTIGRAARNANGEAVLYADRITDSMREAISLTERRRLLQIGLQRGARHRAPRPSPRTWRTSWAACAASAPRAHQQGATGSPRSRASLPDDLNLEIARVEEAMLRRGRRTALRGGGRAARLPAHAPDARVSTRTFDGLELDA